MIAIHNRPDSFSDRWIKYFVRNGIPHKIVNCYDSDIIEQLKDCDGLMWHWSHGDYRAQNFARQLIISVEQMGLKVFPNSHNCWHYDDKVGQKYLLEAMEAPLVPSHVFYDMEIAEKWIKQVSYPLVFKLRGGAGSSNVKLVKSTSQARKLIRKSFGKGFSLSKSYDGLKDRYWYFKRDKNIRSLFQLIKGFGRLLFPIAGAKLLQKQVGYIYFQEFIPENDFDDRIVIIGNRALAIRRKNRTNDFRASGSGLIDHNKDLFSEDAIRIAFNITHKMNAQSLAFDFVYTRDNKPLIVEISYCYSMGPAYDNCPGYWDENLAWHQDNVDPQRYIIEDFIQNLPVSK